MIDGKQQSMREVIDLEIDTYVVKKCLKYYEKDLMELGISVTSVSDLTQQNELFDESNCSFKFNETIEASSFKDGSSSQ